MCSNKLNRRCIRPKDENLQSASIVSLLQLHMYNSLVFNGMLLKDFETVPNCYSKTKT